MKTSLQDFRNREFARLQDLERELEEADYDILGTFDHTINLIDALGSSGAEEQLSIRRLSDGRIRT